MCEALLHRGLLTSIFYITYSRICRGNLPREIVVAICRENLPWEFAAGIFRGNFPEQFSVTICRRFVCICKQILFCVCEEILFIWKQNFFYMWAKRFYLWDFLYQQCFFLLLPWQLWATVQNLFRILYKHRNRWEQLCRIKPWDKRKTFFINDLS